MALTFVIGSSASSHLAQYRTLVGLHVGRRRQVVPVEDVHPVARAPEQQRRHQPSCTPADHRDPHRPCLVGAAPAVAAPQIGETVPVFCKQPVDGSS